MASDLSPLSHFPIIFGDWKIKVQVYLFKKTIFNSFLPENTFKKPYKHLKTT